MIENTYQRLNAEQVFAEELSLLRAKDKFPKPAKWALSPQMVLLYILGGEIDNAKISSKYIGDQKLVEAAIASLLSDRALLLSGVPGTAKSWLSEHLTAAISGDSSLLIQGTSGINEDNLRYGWNYAELIAKGPSEKALVESPVMRAMQQGRIVRIEELSRIPTETQDALITILSEKTLPIPELNKSIHAIQGFNIIATANDNDKGIYEFSSALKRRFNIIQLPLPQSFNEEVNIVLYRLKQLSSSLTLDFDELKNQHIEKLITLFRELRSGKTTDGKQKIKQTQANLSPAEAISIVHHARIQSHYFNQGNLQIPHMVTGIINAFKAENPDELHTLSEYNETVLKKRPEWKEWHDTISQALK